MMISVVAGRRSFTAFSVAVVRLTLRRPFAASASAGREQCRRPRGLVPLDHIAVVGQAGAEEMNQERLRRVAGHRHGCRHGAVSFVPMRENGGRTPSPRTPDRRPAHGRHSPLGGEGRSAGDGCGSAGWHAGLAAPPTALPPQTVCRRSGARVETAVGRQRDRPGYRFIFRRGERVAPAGVLHRAG